MEGLLITVQEGAEFSFVFLAISIAAASVVLLDTSFHVRGGHDGCVE